jgi:hypothetical protein
MSSIKLTLISSVIFGMAFFSSLAAYSQDYVSEKEYMIVNVSLFRNTLRFNSSIDGRELNEERAKRENQWDFNPIILFIKRKNAEGWELKSNQVVIDNSTNSEVFFLMFER